MPTEQPTATSETVILPPSRVTLVFTGQIVPARCVQAETDRLGQADYIYENVVDILRDADLTIGALNASLTDFPPATGCIETFVLIGRPLQADAMANAGFDVMSVASNHIKDCFLNNCGDQGFLATLENLTNNNIIYRFHYDDGAYEGNLTPQASPLTAVNSSWLRLTNTAAIKRR